jgi:hypothetical protein
MEWLQIGCQGATEISMTHLRLISHIDGELVEAERRGVVSLS